MPTYDTAELRTATTGDGVQAIIDTAQQAAAPAELTLGKVYAVRTGDQVKTRRPHRRPVQGDAPTRKTGTTLLRDATSFLRPVLGKHGDDASEVYADADRLTVTAVLNADASDAANWGDHRLRLEVRETDAWKQWTAGDGKLMEQERFAEFVEDHLPEILDPAAATMLEIAQSIQGTAKAEFQSGTRLATGERALKYVETVTAKAGQKNDLVIPETFTVGLLPFEGLTDVGYKITARLRYRIEGAGLRLGYKLDRPADVRAKAFAAIVDEIRSSINHPILNGTPSER
jgi:uncharacterized protein YfdQ (DUF2303 family)